MERLDLERAADVFCAGFCYTRSFAFPFETVRSGRLRIMRDAQRTKGDIRSEEIVVIDTPAEETVAAIREYQPGRFFLCVIHAMDRPEKEIKESYKQHAFRLLRREPLMVRQLDRVDMSESPFPIQRVVEAGLAEKIAKAAGSRQILPPDLHEGDATLRLYAAMNGEEPIGWVRSIRTDPQCAWVSNMYVRSDYRRRGVGQALMSFMLKEDAFYGVTWSVLLASDAGSKLYPNVGYSQIGLLQLFAPNKDVWGLER